MIKRFNPDFSLSISHELAYMRETPEGGYVAQGDYATLFSELEVVKVERDALERQLSMSEAKCKGYFSDAAAALVRCDALAVENAALKDAIPRLRDIDYSNDSMDDVSLAEDIGFNAAVTQINNMVIETPATDSALADIEARGAVAVIENLIRRKERALAEMHPDTHAYGATQEAVRNQIYDLELFATELREAK